MNTRSFVIAQQPRGTEFRKTNVHLLHFSIDVDMKLKKKIRK